ncbi:MAG: septal ring lytic transglycosylase RlpA family protein [Methylophilaceae bacterium]|jgi:rare lipoprotein A
MMKKTYFLIIVCCLTLIACGGNRSVKPSKKTSTSNNGGYYGSDGPPAKPPSNLDKIPNATPKVEALYKYSSKPYVALGEKYIPLKTAKGYKRRGVASWYGKMFHGKKTAIGETYDMYSMTAAHTILPLPSYVKVTNIKNGRSVVVRVNDRGPFKHKREIDLSYVAAHQLRLIEKGSGMVEVEAIDPKHYITPPQAGLKDAFPKSVTTVTTTPNTKQLTTGQHYVQAGAFGNENNAIALQNRINGLDIEDISKINRMYNDDLYRLTVGPYQTRQAAEKTAQQIRNILNTSTIILIK